VVEYGKDFTVDLPEELKQLIGVSRAAGADSGRFPESKQFSKSKSNSCL